MSFEPPDTPSSHGNNSERTPNRPVLRRTVSRPASYPDPVDAAFVANRLTTLTHDLANLLDGSLRVVTLARRNLSEGSQTTPSGAPCHGADRVVDQRTLEELAAQLTTLHAAMAQMAELVKGSMNGLTAGACAPRGTANPFDAGLSRFAVASTLPEAIHHAVDVMRPIADDSCIRLDTQLDGSLETIPAGPIYSVIVSGVRNAIEALQRLRATCRVSGEDRVVVRASAEPTASGSMVQIEIVDNGAGVPADAREKPGAVFRLGYTTKPGGSGVGLAVSFDLVRQMGGSIELLPCQPEGPTGRSGAVLRVRYPAPRPTDDQMQIRVPAA